MKTKSTFGGPGPFAVSHCAAGFALAPVKAADPTFTDANWSSMGSILTRTAASMQRRG